MIQVEGIEKEFGGIHALREVSFGLKPATISIVAGADGAGKSTLLKILVGLVQPDRGSISFIGRGSGKEHGTQHSFCGYMPERFSLYPDLTVEENLNFFADIHGVPALRREEMKTRLLKKTGMERFSARRALALSGGMKQKLALMSILLSSPELIILDEPTTGVDPLSRMEFFSILQDLKGEGKTILLSTPYLDEAEKGDYLLLLKKGRVLIQNSLEKIRADFPVRVFRLVPRGNLFEALNQFQKDPRFQNNVYIKGQGLRFWSVDPEIDQALRDAGEVFEETPTLEDIYIYYERFHFRLDETPIHER